MQDTEKRAPSASARPWHALAAEEALGDKEVEPARGLASEEAGRRLREQGANELQRVEARPWWKILLLQFHSIVVYLLGAAALLAFATGRWPEGLAVLAVILVNSAIGFVSEWKAAVSMAALRKLGEPSTRVRRAGEEVEVLVRDLVAGDMVLLEAGDLVPADLRLVEGEHLRVNEASLTGESVPADKMPAPVEEGADLAVRSSMLYKGTSVVDGWAEGVAVATGPRTELGRISKLAEEAEATATPLRQHLDDLGRHLAWLTLTVAVVVAAVGAWIRHQEMELVVETALALGVAAIPEGLPIVATIALARGMYLMSRREALVNRLTAVETLGATRVIFSDKTGTLTENRLELVEIVTPEGELSLRGEPDHAPDFGRIGRRALEVGVLCNAASLEVAQCEDDPHGDPTEIALLEGGQRAGVERSELLESRPEVRVENFEPRLQKMATIHSVGEEDHLVAVKGSPEAVLEVSNRVAAAGEGDDEELDEASREEWRERAAKRAREGLRVLALADRRVGTADVEPYEDLCFLGLAVFEDPPREQVRESIDRCQAAGIRVAMVTGDQAETAVAIARAVGITGGADDPATEVLLGREVEELDEDRPEDRRAIHRANVFARTSPEQKLELVRAYQDAGEIVAMTGDGVNDAPALKKADIGVAMGRRGTEAARQVADMVLRDDSFRTIVAAVEQGRVIFANIRRSVMFMLCTNVAEVVAVATATFAGWPLPLRPLQILYLNVLTDVFPALALGVGAGCGTEMDEEPRDPDEAVITARHWRQVVGWALLIAACVLSSLLLARHWLGLATPVAVTVSFLTLAFTKLWFPFNLRSSRSPRFVNEITRNPLIWLAIVLCTALLLAAVYLPGLSDVLDTRPPPAAGWALLLTASLVPLVLGLLRAPERSRSAGTSERP